MAHPVKLIAEGKPAKIVLKPGAEARLTAALEKAQCVGAHIPDASDLIKAAAAAELRLDRLGISKVNRRGCKVTYRGAGAWAKAYRYAKTVPHFQLSRGASGWNIVHVGRAHAYPQQPEIDEISLSKAAYREAIINYLKAKQINIPGVSIDIEPDPIQCPHCTGVFWPGDKPIPAGDMEAIGNAA